MNLTDDEIAQVRALLERAQPLTRHDIERLRHMAEVLTDEAVERLPAMVERDKWWEGFSLRTKRFYTGAGIVTGLIVLGWQNLVAFLKWIAHVIQAGGTGT